jgi:hypothetical protein
MLDRRWLWTAFVWCGCAHTPLSGADLDRVSRPAFLSRIEENAGPQVIVFQGDGTYRPKLKKLDTKEADRRLRDKLSCAMNRFEISERLRAGTLSLLPKQRPWTATVDPVSVAHALESFLAEEVPANPPDLDLLKPLGTDAVIEIVVERYGMRSESGHAGVFLEGHARMVLLPDDREVWYRAFRVDQIDSGEPALDPFAVAKEIKGDHCSEAKGALYPNAMQTLLDAVATQFATDLSPGDRHPALAPSAKPAAKADDLPSR